MLKRFLHKMPGSIFLRDIKKRLKVYLHDAQNPPVILIRKLARKINYRNLENRRFPPVVHVEVTNACNARCIMCPQPQMQRKITYIKDDLYRKIVDECAQENLKSFWTFMIGEPLLDKTLPDKIRYAKQKGIKQVGFFTNAALLKGRLAEAIINSGVDHITISFDALDRETFEKIRPPLKFEAIVDNIKNFIQLRNRNKKRRPFVAIEFVCLDTNQAQARAFIKQWEKIVDAVYISSAVNWAGDVEIKSAPQKTYQKRRPCLMLWRNLVIHANGRAVVCCYDYEGGIIIGDVNRQTIKDIWQGAKFEYLRQRHQSGEFEKLELCAQCDIWRYPSSSNAWWA